MSSAVDFLSLPQEILIMLPDYLCNLEDLMNLSSTCRGLRNAMSAASSHTILHLAAAQSRIFFRPSPHFLVTVTARDLGNWARESASNEETLVKHSQMGVEGLLELALSVARCGLTMERIRELHALRFSLINPVTDILDKCVGKQWYETPNFWDGGVDDAYTIDSDPSETLFHLAMYGELFAPDFDPFLDGVTDKEGPRRLSIQTRLEFIKYCLPDFYCVTVGSEGQDPRRAVKEIGPYAHGPNEQPPRHHNNIIALTWVIRSSRFRPLYKQVRAEAGVEEFRDDFEERWSFNNDSEQNWRQRLLEDIMVCQGLEGLGMLRPDTQHLWHGKIREWRDKIAKLEREPPTTKIGQQITLEYPYLLGDLRICTF